MRKEDQFSGLVCSNTQGLCRTLWRTRRVAIEHCELRPTSPCLSEAKVPALHSLLSCALQLSTEATTEANLSLTEYILSMIGRHV